LIGNPKIITKFIAVLLFAVVLVIGNNVVELLNGSDVVIEDKVLTDSNDIESKKEVAEITAKALVSSSTEKLEITAEVKVKEEKEIIKPVIVYDGLTIEELTNKLNRVLKSTLTGTGGSFANYSIQLGVDPYLAVAIVLQETGCYWGTCSAMVDQCYNVGGMKGGYSSCWGGSYAAFPTLDEGIQTYIYNLYNNYVSRGLTTAEAMNASYAEDTLWASRVNNYINIIKNS
jgi:hypothetical protein